MLNDHASDAHAGRSLDGSSWPEALDAARAAPEHHRLLLENPSVRVLDTRIEPGQTVKLHTHRWPAVYYFLQVGEFVRRDHEGTVLADSRQQSTKAEVGQAAWAAPMGPHTLENVGTTPIHVVSVEIKAGVP